MVEYIASEQGRHGLGNSPAAVRPGTGLWRWIVRLCPSWRQSFWFQADLRCLLLGYRMASQEGQFLNPAAGARLQAEKLVCSQPQYQPGRKSPTIDYWRLEIPTPSQRKDVGSSPLLENIHESCDRGKYPVHFPSGNELEVCVGYGNIL